MTNDEFRTLIVSSIIVDDARELANTFEGGVGMWKRPLYQSSEDPTHYLSSGGISPTIASQLPHSEWLHDTDTGEWTATEHPGDLAALVEAVNADHPDENLTLQMAEALIPHVDISTQSPEEAMARMGLSYQPTVADPEAGETE